MRIAHVCPRYFPALGGAEEVIKNYAERLAARGHQVSVYCSDLAEYEHLFNEKVTAPREETLNGVRVVRSWAVPFKFFHSYPLYPSLLWNLARSGAEVVHLHGTRYFASDAGALVARTLSKPWVFNPYAGQFLTSKAGRLHQKLVGWLPFKAEAVINISQYEKELVESKGVHPKRWEHLPVGVDPQPFDEVSGNVYENYGIERQPIVLSLGRLVPHKGLDTLLKAAPLVLQEVPETKFFIAGRDYGIRSQLEKLVEKLNLTESVIFAGSLSEEEKSSAFRNATVFCLPSRSEAFGIVLIEAMAGRLPAVASDWMAMPEIVENGKTGFLFPLDDFTVLADRLTQLIKDDPLRRRMGEAGRVKVETVYSWPRVLDKLEGLYLSLTDFESRV